MYKLFIKHKEITLYLIFGGLTTLVNIIVFYLFDLILFYQLANVIAWIVSVTFAFLTNKYFVFEKKESNDIKKEGVKFFFFRILSLIFDLVIMFVMIDILKIVSLVSKIIANVVVVVLNYFFSKIFIFKK